MAKRVDCVFGQESGMMHGAVVDDLEQCVVFVLDVDVVEVDEAVCATG